MKNTTKELKKKPENVNEWMHQAPIESVSLFVLQSPTTAKRLHFDVLPKASMSI